MATTNPWPLIHAEREALAADLAALTGDQWTTRSLCTDWTVRDVLGHMTATAKMTPPKFFASFAAAGFKFNNMTAKEWLRRLPRHQRPAWRISATISRTRPTRRGRSSRCSARR